MTGGTIALTGRLVVRADKVGKDTQLAHLIAHVLALIAGTGTPARRHWSRRADHHRHHHDHADRVRSCQLLAEEWARR